MSKGLFALQKHGLRGVYFRDVSRSPNFVVVHAITFCGACQRATTLGLYPSIIHAFPKRLCPPSRFSCRRLAHPANPHTRSINLRYTTSPFMSNPYPGSLWFKPKRCRLISCSSDALNYKGELVRLVSTHYIRVLFTGPFGDPITVKRKCYTRNPSKLCDMQNLSREFILSLARVDQTEKLSFSTDYPPGPRPPLSHPWGR